MAANNRFAETKLAFFIGVAIAILSVANSLTSVPTGPRLLIAGGSAIVLNVATLVSLLFSAAALVPQLTPHKFFDWLIPKTKYDNIFYFLTIANFSSSEAWLAASGIKVQEHESLRANRVADQIFIVAKITARKFAVLRYSILLLVMGWVGSWIVLLAERCWS